MSIEDIADRELPRLEKLIEERKSGWVSNLSRSKAALLVIAVLVFLFQIRNLPEKLAGQSLDASIAAQQRKDARSVRLIVINDSDYQSRFSATSPLNPDTLSKLLEAIATGGAKALIVDIDTSASPFAVMKAPSIPTIWVADGQATTDGKFTVDRPLGGREMPAGSIWALALVPNDDRGIVRSYRRLYELKDGNIAESPGYAMARLLNAARIDHSVVSRTSSERFLDYQYRFLPNKAGDVLSDATSKSWRDISMFKDQVVVVGATYRAARDRYATPAGLLYGCEIVAQEAEAEIDGTSIPSASRWLTGCLLVLGGLATMALYHRFSLCIAFLLSLLFVPLLSIASNWILFHRFAAWGAMVPLISAVIVAELYAEASLYLDLLKKVSAIKSQSRSEAVVSDDSEALPGPS